MAFEDDQLATLMKEVLDMHVYEDNKYIWHACRFTNNFRAVFDPTKIFFNKHLT